MSLRLGEPPDMYVKSYELARNSALEREDLRNKKVVNSLVTSGERLYVKTFGAIGDGVTYAHEEINAALETDATVIEFEPGATYLIGSDIHFRSGQRLIGNGATIKTDAGVKYMFRNEDIDQANYGGGEGIIIEGFIFDGEATSRDLGFIGVAHTTNVTVRHCVFQNLTTSSGLHMIDAAGNERLTVEKNLFIDCVGATALQIDAATSGSMPTFTTPNLETASGTRSHGIKVRDNWFVRCGNASSSFQAVHLHKKGHSRISIVDNHFFDCWGAIRDDIGSLYRGNGATTDIEIHGNTIDATSSSSFTGGGVVLDFVTNVSIKDNIILGYGPGIMALNYATPVTITGITQANPAVVTATAHSLPASSIVYVSGVAGMTEVNGKFYKIANELTNSFELTELHDGSNVDSTGFTAYTSGGTAQYSTMASSQRNDNIEITGNIITATGSTGIQVENSENLTIDDNQVLEYGEYNDHRAGIKLVKCVRSEINDNIVKSSTSGTKNGIVLHRSYRYGIGGNDIQNCAVGIYIDKLDRTQSDFGRIEGNHLDTGTTYMIWLRGNTSNLITAVAVSDNTFYGEFSGHAIRVDRGTRLTVSGNIMDDMKTTAPGVSFNNVVDSTIQGNTLSARSTSTVNGIHVFGSAGGSVSVTGNTVDNFDKGVVFDNSAADGTVTGNTITNSVTAAVDVPSSVLVRDNFGYVTEENGTATLADGTTSIAVTHGLDVTPALSDISVTPIEAWGSATTFWISSPTSTQFTINVDADPTQDVDFAWTASVR